VGGIAVVTGVVEVAVMPRSAASRAADPSGRLRPALADASCRRSTRAATANPAALTTRRSARTIRSVPGLPITVPETASPEPRQVATGDVSSFDDACRPRARRARGVRIPAAARPTRIIPSATMVPPRAATTGPAQQAAHATTARPTGPAFVRTRLTTP